MRIGIDARAARLPQRGGFKTYATNLVKGLARIDGRNEYILYFDRDGRPDTEPLPANFSSKVLSGRLPLLGTIIREQVILPNCLDKDDVGLAHFLCNTAPRRYRRDFIVTVHDLYLLSRPLQLAFSEGHWRGLALQLYMNYLLVNAVQRANAIITDSEHSKNDILDRFAVPATKVFVVSLAPNEIFRPLGPKQEVKTEVERIFDIPQRQKYILGIGSAELRKNVVSLIRAYSHLDEELRDKYRLVLVSAGAAFEGLLSRAGIQGKVERQITCIQSQPHDRLLLLYNAAELFVFLSLYEGFGMPPLEAMACGAPVICSNVSSLPEVVGDAAMMVDPLNHVECARAIQAVLTNRSLREQLGKKGLERSKLFTWERTAEGTLKVYEEVFRARSD